MGFKGPVPDELMWNSLTIAVTSGVVVGDDSGIRNNRIETVAMTVGLAQGITT